MITIITQAMTHYQAYTVLITHMYTICLNPNNILIKICKINARNFSKFISEKDYGHSPLPPILIQPWTSYIVYQDRILCMALYP